MKYFGTDGIRKLADTELTPDFVYNIAKAGAYVIGKHLDHKPTIIIGRDTRISGEKIENSLATGFLDYGANVKLVGVLPTPGIAYLTRKTKADASVVISASHNSFEYNGIKFFNQNGMKISDELEEEIEQIMDSKEEIPKPLMGTLEKCYNLYNDYHEFFVDTFKDDFKKLHNDNFKVVIDTANGATSDIAEKVFTSLNINHITLFNKPDGININDNCGSTHLDQLRKFVVDNHYNLGVAYDGDGDRCLAVDENGEVIDGDIILAIMSKELKKENKLKNNCLVATVMSNIGLKKYCEENDIEFKQTKVGDRYVLEEMLKNEDNLGGEQSGHIIFADYNPTGDGILTSLFLIKVLLEEQIEMSELKKIINIYPQVLINAKVSNDKKDNLKNDKQVLDEIEKINNSLENNGRVLVRASGTEPLIRVMIEGQDINYITEKAQNLAKLIEERFN